MLKLSSAFLNNTSNITCRNITASGALSAGSISTSGALSAGSISTSGALSAGSISTSGALSAGSISTSGALSAGSISTSDALYIKSYIQPMIRMYTFIAGSNNSGWIIPKKGSNVMIQISLNNTFGTFLATNITTTTYAPGYIYNGGLLNNLAYFTPEDNGAKGWIFNSQGKDVVVTEYWF